MHFRTLLREAIKASDPAILSDTLRRAYSSSGASRPVVEWRHA